jgi:hypothetical protein
MLSEKQAESLIIKNDIFTDDINLGLGIVKKYIINNDLILVGGMAIDYSMRLKGSKLYDDDVLPDYDCYSYNHNYDAYKIAELLTSSGLKNITVINANHTSTMRVRVNYTVVADITYIPKNIYTVLPTLLYKDIKIISPHYQIIDQHRSLSLPYENKPFEVILHRWKKDAIRYDMLYKLYPLKDKLLKLYKSSDSNITSSDDTKKISGVEIIKISSLNYKNECIGGISGLLYWKKKAEENGFSSNIDFFKNQQRVDKTFGKIDIDEIGFVFSMPKNSSGITIYTDTIHKLKKNICECNNIKDVVMYNRFLDKLPFSIKLDNKFELFDNYGILLSAYRLVNDIYIANLQNIALYLLCHLIILKDIYPINNIDKYYYGYLLVIEIVEWAGLNYSNATKKNNDTETSYNIFLPTSSVYGASDISDSYINSKRLFMEKLGEIKKSKYQPENIYPDTFVGKKIPPKYYKFNPSKSPIYNFDVKKTTTFYSRNYV